MSRRHRGRKGDEVSGATIGTSVAAAILVATLIVLIILFILWKKKCLEKCRDKDKPKEKVIRPPISQPYKEIHPKDSRLSDSDDVGYSKPYDYVNKPRLLHETSEENEYAEVEKREPLPKAIKGSKHSLTITENELYSHDSMDNERVNQSRTSAGILIVENEGYGIG